ncbi:MAG TPA: septation protein SepH [Acidimicrobiales bacterium]|nr:septation protein SepH [Acidimicrobiales bacterium]
MQQLHLVGFTTDLEGLIFSARKGAKSGGYLVMLDDRLQATIEDALRLRNGDDDAFDDNDDGSAPSARPRRPKPQSTLSPREIQARLRAGSSIAEIAEEAGVDEEWVGRFAAPILAEQAQVVARARRLTFEKPRLGQSALDLGEAVRWNLADRDIRFLDDDFDAAWSAYNLQGTSWVVRFHYASRGKRQTAEWEVDLRENELFARNRIASDLAYIDATRRRRRPPVLEPSARETPASAGTRRDSAPAAPPAPAAKPAPRLPTAAVAGRGSAGKAATTGRGKATASSARGATSTSAGRAAPAKAAARPAAKASRKAAKPTRKAAKATPAKAAAPRRATTAAKAAKAAKSVKAAKVTKATGTRRAAATKRGRATATKAAAKKPAPEHRGTASAASPPLEIAERRSHLARPASPMKSANPVPPRPGEEGFRVIGRQADDGRVRLPAPRPEALAPRPRPPAPAATPTPEPAPERQAPAPAPARPRAEAPAVEQQPRPAASEPAAAEPAAAAAAAASRPPTPEERVARRLAARQNGGDAGRSGRVRRAAPEQPAESHEPVWHGPGSGEPAPAVRIRADMAAATVRPHDHSDDVAAEPPAAAPRRRRERPLRAR